MQNAINPLAVFGLDEPTTDAQIDAIIDRLESMQRRDPSNIRIKAAIRHVGAKMRAMIANDISLAIAA